MSQAREALIALAVLFLVIPGVFLVLMLIGGLPLTTIGGVEVAYYVIVIVGLLLKGLKWLEDAFG